MSLMAIASAFCLKTPPKGWSPKGMEQVSNAMESIKQASIQNVDSSHQLETAANDLQEVGQVLKQSVERYTY